MRRRRILLGLGCAAVLAAAADRARVWIVRPEKDAFYAFGHWFDVPWEIDAPLAAIGAVLIAAALWSRSRS